MAVLGNMLDLRDLLTTGTKLTNRSEFLHESSVSLPFVVDSASALVGSCSVLQDCSELVGGDPA